VCIGLVNLPVEQSDFWLFHLIRGALSADFRQTYPSALNLASLILRILKTLCLNIFVPRVFRVPIKVIVIDFQLKESMPVKIAGRLTTGSNPQHSFYSFSPYPQQLFLTPPIFTKTP
jgi:hypothetical protein